MRAGYVASNHALSLNVSHQSLQDCCVIPSIV